MKNLLIFFISTFTLASFQSCKNCNSYLNLDSRAVECVFKVGSYFVYNDSSDQIIDSEYVYQYTYHINSDILYYRDDCYTYGDELSMSQSSFHNGVLYDKIYTDNSGPEGIGTYDSLRYYYSSPSFFYPYTDTFISNNFVVSGHVYPTVYKNNYPASTVKNGDTIPTDFYYAPNYGIIKRVEHRPTGDVSWDLIRYHIVQ